MAKKKKKVPAEYIAHYVREGTTDVFVLGATAEEVMQWHEEDRYGLIERDFHLCTVFKLVVVRRHDGERLPVCGCYESAAQIYVGVVK